MTSLAEEYYAEESVDTLPQHKVNHKAYYLITTEVLTYLCISTNCIL